MSKLEKQSLGLLLLRPTEPLIVPKGEENIVFEMPEGFYSEKYRKHIDIIREKFEVGNFQTVTVKNITVPVNTIAEASEIESFSVFNPKHMDSAVALITKFMESETIEDLISIAAYCRERLDPMLFNYVHSVALLHRPDTKDVVLPNLLSSLPGKFVEATVVSDARRVANLIPAEAREPIVINKNFTASDREPEQAVAYFREDIGINLHHWHWHLVYPHRGPPNVVGKDRRGELFYYMHQQMLARFNIERLCNNMDMVIPIQNFRQSFTEAYFSKLTQMNSSRAWPPRFKDTFLSDLDRPSEKLHLNISSMESWVEYIKQAIREGKVISSDGTEISLDPIKGIDILGNLIESSILSVNPEIYGDLHNKGHILIACCHDPQDKYLEGPSIMGDVATALRDPIFFRWHTFINDLFVAHKNKLPPYTDNELNFNNVTISQLFVDAQCLRRNMINTFWETSDIDLSGGLDFLDKNPLLIRVTYLQHGQFTYTLVVNNANSELVFGTVRIFMSPKFNKNQEVHSFENERQLMIEMDKFAVSLAPGLNMIKRRSSDSSVTIDHEMTFKTVDSTSMTADELNQNTFCGCGWPDNMLVPKGNTARDGYTMNLFAMVSDYKDDHVNQNPPEACPGADSFCGLLDRKYPDKRSMGYPFDRRAGANVARLSNFLTPNMKVTEISLRHTNETSHRRPATSPRVVST